MDALILTGWGWKEYAVAAAAALRALDGRADVLGMSKRRLPEFLESEGSKWKKIYLIGLSLGGDETRLAEVLRNLRRQKTSVMWISTIPMTEAQRRTIAPLLKVVVDECGFFNGALVKTVGAEFGVDVTTMVPYAIEGNKLPKSVPRYHELIAAAMYMYRNFRDSSAYPTAIGYLANAVPETAWSPEMNRLVENYRRWGARELVGKGEKMAELRAYIERIARHPEARVLILGESGTGKETVALQIHTKSPRRDEPFYAFNCASVNPKLLESRFFGYEKGAFTGADRRNPGLFELADGGTLFLDEIAELPLEAQGVLLRVLEGGYFMRVGGTEELKSDVRLVTATNRDLAARVREGKFREDLFMRLNVIQIRVPSLREHKEDIKDIADGWWFDRCFKHLSKPQVSALMSYDYPGNVRELLNLLERAYVLEETDFVRLVEQHKEMNLGLLGSPNPSEGARSDALEEVVSRHIRNVFYKYAQNLSRAAAALDISRNTLRKHLEALKPED